MAQQAVWKGFLSVGLVNVGVSAHKAIDDPADLTKKKWLHAACNTPVGQKRTCDQCGVADVAMSDIATGVAQADGSYVIVTPSEIAALKPPSTKTVTVEAFVPATSINALFLDSTYYLVPDADRSLQGFGLLREAMRAKGVVMTGRLTLYGRERLVAIRPLGRILALHLLRTLDDVRSPEALPFYAELAAAVDPGQAALAGQLLDIYAGAFDPASYEDQYVAQFLALVEAKKSGRVLPAAAEPAAPPVSDLMAALTRSLAAVQPAAKPKPLKVVDEEPAAAVKKPRAKKPAAA
jgi:DNA end-binding protein Ku